MKIINIIATLLPPYKRWRYLLLLLIIGTFATLTINFAPGIGRVSLDGDYYYQIARNVAEGKGFVTSVSLYNQGIKKLPHKINISPVWPLVLGYVGRIFDLRSTAAHLPEVFFILDLILLYFLTNLLVRRAGMESNRLWIINIKNIRILDIGHLAVLLFGSNRIFFEFTSMPYTEAIGFFFLFVSLILADQTADKRSLTLAALTGFIAAVGFLARVQLIGLLVSIPFVFGIIALRGDKKFFLLCLFTGLGSLVAMMPWIIWLHSWMDTVSLNSYLGMGTLHETPGLRYFSHTVKHTEGISKIKTIMDGLSVAFSPDNKNSYTYSFSWALYLVPLATAEFLAHTSQWKERLSRIFSPRGLLTLVIIISTLISLYPIHSAKRAFFKTWLFGWRHGLPMILLITLSLSYLLTNLKNPLGRLLAVFLVISALMVSNDNIQSLLDRKFRPDPKGPEGELLAWLDKQDPKPTVITTHAQILSVFCRSNFHWADCKLHPNHTLNLLDHANADYVLIYQRERNCNFVKRLIKQKKIKKVKTFNNRWRIEVWERSTPPPEAAAATTKEPVNQQLEHKIQMRTPLNAQILNGK